MDSETEIIKADGASRSEQAQNPFDQYASRFPGTINAVTIGPHLVSTTSTISLFLIRASRFRSQAYQQRRSLQPQLTEAKQS